MALRYLTKKRKTETKERNHSFVMGVYARGKDLMPPEYLTCHQEADDALKAKCLAQAADRRERRAAKHRKTAAPQA